MIKSFNLANGLLGLIGSDVFRDIFGIRSREEIVKTSLTFVIDVASSKTDISMIKSAAEKIVNETKFVPEKYVLVTFSDPGMLSFLKVYVYSPDIMHIMKNSIKKTFQNTKCLKLNFKR